MKRSNVLYYAVVSAILAFGACKPNLDPIPVSAGKNIDLSKYIAVGNSLTAGYADGGLYNEAIMYSYPNFIAKQFKLVGGGDFNQPYFDESQKNGSGFLKITGWNANGTPIITNETNNLAIVNSSTGQLARFTGSSNNNLGIPGLRMIEVLSAPYSQLNPFFERLLPPLTTKRYVDFVKEANGTFFTLWLGNNDVLGYAIKGGDPTGINITDGLYPFSSIGAPNTISHPLAFNAAADSLINALTANGAKGAIALIPDVTTIPFVRTLNQQIASAAGGFPKVTLTATQAAALNALYTTDFDESGPYVPYSNPNFVAGDNYFVISIDNPYTTSVREVRQMNPQTDYFLLSAQALLTNPSTGLAAGLGVAKPNDGSTGISNPPVTQLPNPIPDFAVLDAAEVQEIRTATAAYNAKLRSIADIKGLAVVDTPTILNEIIQNNGIDGVKINSAFITGGLFSLDGIHLTPKGYAVVANQFIKAINAKYEAKIPLIDVNSLNLRTILFP